MSTTTPNPSAPTTGELHEQPLPIRARLAAAWTSLMFLYIYVDYFHLYKPGAIDDLRSGVVFEFDISQSLLTGFLAVVGLPALMVFLSAVLPARANRATNLVVGALYVPVTVFNIVGESWVAFYGLSIVLEMLLLVYILRAVWAWPRVTAPATSGVGRYAAGTLS